MTKKKIQKKNKEIPKSFILGNMKFTTKIKKKVFSNNEQVSRLSDPFGGVVKISQTVNGLYCSIDYQRQSFYHELVHQILDILGDLELSENEEFVQRFSVLLDQFEQTKRF